MNDNSVSKFLLIRDFVPEDRILDLIPKSIAYQYCAFPLWFDGNKLVVAVTSNIKDEEIKALEKSCRYPIKPYISVYSDIINALERTYDKIDRKPDIPKFTNKLNILGHINKTELERIIELQRDTNIELLDYLTSQITEEDFAESVGWDISLPHISKAYSNPGPGLELFIPKSIADDYQVLPLWWIAGVLYVAKSARNTSTYRNLNDIIKVPHYPIYCPPKLWCRLYRNIYLQYHPKDIDYEGAIIRSLFEKAIISETDIIAIDALADQNNLSYQSILVDRGYISEDEWINELAKVSEAEIYKKIHYTIDKDLLSKLRIPYSLAKYHQIIPLSIEDDILNLGLVYPTKSIIYLVEKFTGLIVNPILLSRNELKSLLTEITTKQNNSTASPNIKQIFLGMGLLTREQLSETVMGKFPFYRYIENSYLDDYDIAEALSIQTNLPKVTLDHFQFNENLVSVLPKATAEKHLMVPLWKSERDLWLAVVDPFDSEGMKEIEKSTGLRVRPIIAPKSTVASTIERYYGNIRRKVEKKVNAIIDHMVSNGCLTQKGALDAVNEYSLTNEPLDVAIEKNSIHSPIEIAKILSKLLDLPFTTLYLVEKEVDVIDPLGKKSKKTQVYDPIDPNTAKLMNVETARRYNAIPIKKDEDGLIVAFSDPILEEAKEAIRKEAGLKILPVIAARSDIEAAIERVLGRRNLGSFLLMSNEINRAQLNDALDLANRTGVRLGKALTIRRYITEDQLYQALSRQSKLTLLNLNQVDWDEDIVRKLDEPIARQYGMIPINETKGNILIAVSDPLNEEGLLSAREILGEDLKIAIATDTDIENSLTMFYSTNYLARSISELLERSPKDSAYRVLSTGQKLFLLLVIIVSIIWSVINFNVFIITLNILATTFYLSFSIYKFYLINKATSQSLEVPVSTKDISSLEDRNLPIYTILIPVYREAEVLPELLSAMLKMDYPETKLDIKVLMEADDIKTIQAFKDWNPPPHFHGIIVPYAEPKTKPKACNYGLIHARGDYVVIYDAEDLPEPDQLKRVLVAFNKSPADVVCIQAKLNYFNSRQNLLTSWFTVEYSMWFDLFLPGLAATKSPIPLGGTSNHFKREVLIEAGAWDPYNVTEDADLGIRVHKRKYRTAIVDTTTYEEANSRLNNWIRQRSRWIKGYIQTWLVHMRDPIALIKEIGLKDFLSFQFVIGGTFFAALLNPIYWILTSIWFFFQWDFINQIFPGIIFYFGAICLFLGNFVFTYMNVVGAMRRGYYDLVKHALLSPLYWGFASIAGWKGFLQLITKPHYWEKTTHGFYKKEESEIIETEKSVL
jgi:glycosyltransferase XagB